MRSFIFVSGLLLSFSLLSSAEAAWWEDVFEQSHASLIQYEKPRSSEVKRNIRSRITPRSFSTEKKSLSLRSSAPLFGPEKNQRIGLGAMRERPIPRLGINYKFERELPMRRISNLGFGASSYKQRVRNERGRDRSNASEQKENYLQNKRNTFNPEKHEAVPSRTMEQ